ncbi:MAG: AI-2E family transporter [Ilumatobacteraceae bacterium]
MTQVNDGGSTDRAVILGAPATEPAAPERPRQTWADVPWATIVASVGVVLGTYILVQVVLMTVQVISWIVVAGFFAIVLAPATRRVQTRVGGRRNVATGVVVFTTLGTVFGLLTLFLLPVRTQLINIVTDLPGTIDDAAAGTGPIGSLVTKLHLQSLVQDHQRELNDFAERLSSSSFQYLTAVLSGLIAFLTITVLTFLFLSQTRIMGQAALNLVPARRREAVRTTTLDAAAAVSGYMIGNLIISAIAGTTAVICLLVLGVPSAFVLALFVAVADLVPLVGATIGAIVASLAAFFHSPTAGIIAVIFFVVYQQIENGVLYPAVMARRVKINPLVVLLSVLLSVAIFGFVGALLAVPFAGAIQVAVKAVQMERRREKLVVAETPQSRRRRRRRAIEELSSPAAPGGPTT